MKSIVQHALVTVLLSASLLLACSTPRGAASRGGAYQEAMDRSAESASTAPRGAVSTGGSYPKEEGTVRLVQYNVGAFSKELDNSIPMIAAMMKEIGADALSLNEVDSCNGRHPADQLADFAQAMGGWNHRFGKAMQYLGGGYGVGIAVPGRIIRSFTIPLPKGNGSEPRACVVVETPLFVLASTHLDFADEPSTVVQARTVCKVLSREYSGSRKPVFLAGDMNSEPGSEVLSTLGESFDVLSCRKETFSADRPRVCIDFIMSLRGAGSFDLAGSDVPVSFRDGDVRLASDHLPVYVDVRIWKR